MSHFAVTGAFGFLGWHLRAALREQDRLARAVPVGKQFDVCEATETVDGSARAIHLAGVNRASENEVRDGNIAFAEQLAVALRAANSPPPVVVYANSSQSGNGTVYGEAKARAADVLATAASDIGAEFVDVPLPNIFGEHGRPFYNSVTATFSHLIAAGGTPVIENDKEINLLHAQNASDILNGTAPLDSLNDFVRTETASSLLDRLLGYSRVYGAGEIPNISDDYDRDLFNTYRSFVFSEDAPINLTRRSDARGSFFEVIRSHGGRSQSSISTTAPGITRGNHYHRRKIERFSVLQGQARISLRRLFSNETVSFEVSGDTPRAVDMPTMWAHNIANIGSDTLFTSFWTNDLFDSRNPDTIAEVV